MTLLVSRMIVVELVVHINASFTHESSRNLHPTQARALNY